MVFNPFQRPQSSYERPVPLVLVDPDVDATAIVCFNPEWMPYVLGALQQLVLPTTWDTTDEDDLNQQIARASLLIAQFTTPCGGETMFDVRQGEPCTLEKSTDGGETWVSWADLQLCPPRIRTNKGKLQFFDGTSWVDVPGGGDERYDGEAEPQWTDPPEGESGACLAAENIVASYVTMLTQTKAGLDAVATISGIVDIVAGYIGTQTLFPPALLILNISIAVGALAALGSEAIDDLITSPDVDTLKCLINCHASSDGAFTAAEFAAIQDDVSVLMSEPTRLIMSEWLNSYGPVGLTRAAAANGILDGDCDDCGCTWESVLDFTIDDYSEIITVLNGSYDGANGYIGTPAGGQYYTINLELAHSSADIVRMEMVYSSGGGSGPSDGVAFYTNGPSYVFYGSVADIEAGENIHYSHTGAVSTAQELLSMGTGLTNIPCYAKQWKLRGTGTKPAELP